MPESAVSAWGLIKGVDVFPLRLEDGGDDHLCDAVAAFNGKFFVSVVDEDDLDFASVVGVDGAGGVDHGDAFFDGEAATGTYLGFGADGQGDAESGGDESALAGRDGDGVGDGGAKIHTGGGVGFIAGEGEVCGVWVLGDVYGDVVVGHVMSLSFLSADCADGHR